MTSEEDAWHEELGIKEGATIESSKAKYTIEKLLGEGGFGAVFKVTDKETKLTYAMKVEKKVENRVHSKLKMEIAILKLMEKERRGEGERNHFTQITDRGKKELYFFLIMQLVGKSLQDLKRTRDPPVFSIGTGIGVAIQCLESVEDLHKHNFIHRDLKPANYACGLGNQVRTIFILDFGIARKITNERNELKTPRAQARFKGTVRFASLACHRCKEMSFKDDVESWFYLLLDLIVANGLPWKKLTEKNEVMTAKDNAREKKEGLYGTLKYKDEYHEILLYVDKLEYTDRVDYTYIYEKLKRITTQQGASIDDRYDFEPKK
ncbi:unnamed protein product, partial [Mesorhabditis spiculigera]